MKAPASIPCAVRITFKAQADSGALPNNYPGFQPVIDLANQAKFKQLYGREIDIDKGITKVTALDLCGDEIRAMLIDGENTLLSDPDRVSIANTL